MSRILVTGAAGFIGFHVSHRLLSLGHEVVGIDNLNDYYDPALKVARLDLLRGQAGFRFAQMDLADRGTMADLFREPPFDRVVHLAAQAGVRYSVDHPFVYIDSNVTGFLTVLEGCRHSGVKHLVYASSSSVYGGNTHQPFSVEDRTDHPVSLYGATKKANEAMAHAYSDLYGIPMTGLRFFTVYGPWGRPDMAYFSFTKAILAGREIEVFNHGRMRRDFTYVDDIVAGIVELLDRVPAPNPHWSDLQKPAGESRAAHRLLNIGNNRPVELLHMIELLEKFLGVKARKRFREHQLGDVVSTFADIDSLTALTGFKPRTDLATGLARFVEWYLAHYGATPSQARSQASRP